MQSEEEVKREIGELRPIPKSFRFYKDPSNSDQDHGPGIKVQVVPHSKFHEITIFTLNAIYATETGRRVIECLVRAEDEVSIIKASYSNSCDVGPNGMTQVAQELRKGHFGHHVRAALEKLYQPLKAIYSTGPYSWLANNINSCPVYKLEGEPTRDPWNIGVTAEHVRGWIDGSLFLGNFKGKHEQNHIVCSVITLLDECSAPGTGSGAQIAFYADHGLANSLRPAGIGLAHELIHAYWSALGRQPGWPFGEPTTVLFEHKCVGFGHWEHYSNKYSICENQIRREWFGATANLFELDDKTNRQNPGRRNLYDD